MSTAGRAHRTGTADLPILSSVVEAIGSSITLTVEARARADIDP
jgi:hypothetical protein